MLTLQELYTLGSATLRIEFRSGLWWATLTLADGSTHTNSAAGGDAVAQLIWWAHALVRP
jgi:hypothetical protein